MIRLTAPNGASVAIDGKLVLRVRRTVASESGGEFRNAKTRIDWAVMQLVNEAPDEVAALIKAELPSLTALTSRDGSRIWFNAKQAVGPLPVTPTQIADGANSCVKIVNHWQFVMEMPEEVRAVIAAAGGTPVGEVGTVS
jgi:hypothetical protein